MYIRGLVHFRSILKNAPINWRKIELFKENAPMDM